nr:hypothetical protein [uncultured Sediminibacterium sp.]
MRLIFLFTTILTFLSGYSQNKIELSEGTLLINNKPISNPANKAMIDDAIGAKGKYRFLIRTHEQGKKLENDTKHHMLIYKEEAVSVSLSAPGYQVEEVLIQMSIEPKHDLPNRLRNKKHALYQGVVQIGDAKLTPELTYDNIDRLFNPADIIMKGNRVVNKKTVPYAIIKQNDWLIELMFSYESNLIKFISVKH